MTSLTTYSEFMQQMPTSWNYGAFNHNSKMQSAYKTELVRTLMVSVN